MAIVFVAQNGVNLGGFDPEGVRNGLVGGQFTKDDLAWVDGMPTWLPLPDVLAKLPQANEAAKIVPLEKSGEPNAPDKGHEPIVYTLKPTPIQKDDHGQPRRLFRANFENNVSKAIDQLSGICTGILADGIVTDKEALFFREWVKNHAILEPIWPFTDILDRVEKVFSHGKIDDEERSELAEIMRSITGEVTVPDATTIYSSNFPLDSPEPALVFNGNEFVITGRFAYGTRKKVIEAIESREGIGKDGFPTLSTRYLVIGTFASRDWYNTNYGRKIERAVELRKDHQTIAILSEEHWKSFL